MKTLEGSKPEISIVIPVYNEEESLPHLFERLIPAMEALDRPYEIVFVNDGSRDRSIGLLLDLQKERPDRVRVVDLSGNFGQHMAILAGFDHVRGNYILTLDADLQNPPEEIANLVRELDAGHDVVGTYRVSRVDPFFRKFASKIVNRISRRITGISLKDYGCMLRGYHRSLVEIINTCCESTTFIPALAQKFAANPVEIPVSHSERGHGHSKYGFSQLIRLNFDLMTSFSLVPLQFVTMTGIAVSLASLAFSLFLVVRRLIVGPEAEGLFTLMAINFLLIGFTMFCSGILGEYIGRIYREVQHRPRYSVKKIYEQTPGDAS